MPIGLGNSTQLGIGIAIGLQDRFSPVADRIYKKLMQLKSSSRGVVDSAIRDYIGQATAISAGAGLVSRGYYRMARSASEFGHKINQIDIIGDGKLGRTKKQLSDFALGLSRDFATLPTDVADAMLENTRAGVTKGLDVVTKYQLAVSKATGETTQAVSERLLGIANAMQIPMNEFGRVANATTSAANASMASVFSIGESMEYAAFTAKQFNIPLEQTLALVAKLSQSNIKGSSAGTALNNMIQYLGSSTSGLATKKQKQMWDLLGIDRGGMKNLMDNGKIFEAIATMDKAMSRISPSDRITILRNLTNMRGARGMLGAWGSNDPSKSLSGLLASIQGGVNSDIAIGQSRRMMNDPYSQFMRVQVAWEQFKIKFIGASAPALMTILKGAEKVAHLMGIVAQTPIGKVLGTMVAVGAPLISVLFGLRAASLAATFALRGLSGARGFGYRDLLGAGMGMAGGRAPMGINYLGIANSGVNPYYNQMLRTASINSAGRWFVQAGKSMTYGGKLFGPGQLLPMNFNPTMRPSWGAPLKSPAGMMLGSTLLNASGGAASATTWLGKMGQSVGGAVGTRLLPLLGQAAGFLGRLVPIVGWGVTIWSIYDLLKSDHDDREKIDPVFAAYKRQMDEQIKGYLNPYTRNIPVMNMNGLFDNKDKPVLQQNLVVNVDGQTALRKALEQYQQNFQNNLQFNIQQ